MCQGTPSRSPAPIPAPLQRHREAPRCDTWPGFQRGSRGYNRPDPPPHWRGHWGLQKSPGQRKRLRQRMAPDPPCGNGGSEHPLNQCARRVPLPGFAARWQCWRGERGHRSSLPLRLPGPL